MHEPNHRHRRLLLRPRRERPRGSRATDERGGSSDHRLRHRIASEPRLIGAFIVACPLMAMISFALHPARTPARVFRYKGLSGRCRSR
jgi:hypothetical protein